MAAIVTTEQLQNASLDTQTLEKFVNGTETQVNNPRLLPSVDIGSLAELRKNVQDRVDLQIATLPNGHKGYATLAAAQAAQASLPANTLVEVTNDSDSNKNGLYLWDGSALTKSSFDAVAQSKQVVNTAVYGKVNTIEDTVIYSEDGVKLITVPYLSDFFAADLQVKSGDYYLINANSYGDVRAYYIADANDKLLKYSDSVVTNELVQMPSNAVRLVVNCTKATRNSFYVKLLTPTDVDLLNKIKAIDPSNNITVASAFPQRPSYSFLLKDKCPNFYKKLKEKSDDFTVCLTGTSLTQGNLYATDRSDGTTRPPQLHTNDLASAIFDSLISHWDGQQYRRYDHVDLSYSASNWTVTNDAQSGGTSIWDDRAEYRNGLTKTTTDANASVAMTIPANAWQFNFIHRTDSQGGNRTVTISQGSGLVEAFNGSAWVEANGFVFSSLEPAATTTKGNTIYQKRLKMRCKNKVGGINSIGQTKTITISKGNDATRFNVVGFEWSQREFMLTLINSARGSHNWGLSNGYNLENYQDGDIWEFNPDLLLCETTTINWGGSWGYDVDPLYYVNIAKRAYFNEFNDNQNSLYVKSNAYRNCDVIFYGDTVSAHTDQSASWDGQQPKFATVTTAANNGNSSTENVGRVKNIFENYAEVESYMASKEYVFIPVSAVFKNVANKYFGNYWDAFRGTDKAGATLSYDAIHLNDNGYKLWSLLICPLFDNL